MTHRGWVACVSTLLVGSALAACSDDDEGTGGGTSTTSSSTTSSAGPTTSASATTSTGAGGGECTEGVLIDAAELVQESVEQLRGFFGMSTGLDGGALYYRDGVTSIGSCPVYDQSSIIYSVPVDPSLVPLEILAGWPGKVPHVNYNWGLNGSRYVFFSNEDLTAPGASWGLDRSPVSVCATLEEGVTAQRLAEIEQALHGVAGEVPVETYFDTVICWGPGIEDENAVDLDAADQAYFESVLAIASEARMVDEFIAIEWSGIVYGLEWELGDAVPVQGAAFRPECLRTISRELMQDFASLPSFGPPFGQGWQQNGGACQ